MRRVCTRIHKFTPANFSFCRGVTIQKYISIFHICTITFAACEFQLWSQWPPIIGFCLDTLAWFNCVRVLLLLLCMFYPLWIVNDNGHSHFHSLTPFKWRDRAQRETIVYSVHAIENDKIQLNSMLRICVFCTEITPKIFRFFFLSSRWTIIYSLFFFNEYVCIRFEFSLL